MIAPGPNLTPEQQQDEIDMCAMSFIYFIVTYVRIFDAALKSFIPFDLWPEQEEVLWLIHENQRVAILKARQLGLTWLCLAYALWLMLFRPSASVLIFSLRQDEAWYLLGEERLRGMYHHLPDWMTEGLIIENDSISVFALNNGSVARAFPTTAGDSYTATFAMADEFDLVPNQGRLLRSVQPTIENGGKLVLVSRADKDRPTSDFKKTFLMGMERLGGWVSAFLGWFVHPGRTTEWYAEQCEAAMKRDGSLDTVHEQFPSTAEEAIQPRSLSKRFAPQWVTQCYVKTVPLSDEVLKAAKCPAINGLRVWALPQPGEEYVIGADTAEGKITGDAAAFSVLNKKTREQVAAYAGPDSPETLGHHIDQVGKFFNRAAVMIERNNTGHACILWMRQNSRLKLLHGHDAVDAKGHRRETLHTLGWLSSELGKVIMYTEGAECLRDKATIIHDQTTYTELISIERDTLRAPEGDGLHDDCSDAFVIALCAIKYKRTNFTGVW